MMLRLEDSMWIKNFPVYFRILQNIQKLYLELMFCGFPEVEEVEEKIYLLSVQISRIIPLHGKKGLSFIDKKLDFNNGVLMLKKYVNFLEDDYNELYKNCKSTLITLSDIRNKYEHEPHNIIGITYFSNTKEQKMKFAYKKYSEIFLDNYSKEIQEKIKSGEIKSEWTINTPEIGKIVLQLNNIFKKIQTKYINASKVYKELSKYPVYNEIINMDFEGINNDILFYVKSEDNSKCNICTLKLHFK